MRGQAPGRATTKNERAIAVHAKRAASFERRCIMHERIGARLVARRFEEGVALLRPNAEDSSRQRADRFGTIEALGVRKSRSKRTVPDGPSNVDACAMP